MKFYYDYCVWDFNGTILDDVELGMNSVNALLSQQGLPCIPNKEEYRKRFDFPIIEYYKRLGFDFEKRSYEILAEEWIALYLQNLHNATMFPGVIDALNFFDNKGVKQTILSASERKMLIGQLDGLGISNRFEEILGIDNIYGDSKLSIALDWRSRHTDSKVMFIGDTTHDCQTAKVLDADCYIVSAGHQCSERFINADAKIFPTLDNLIDYLRKF